MIKKIQENSGDAFAQSMQNILNDVKHQKLFKKANAEACHCSKECECEGEKCACKGSCTTTCPSCGKEKTVEAANEIIQELLQVSATLDERGFEKQSILLCKMAEIYSKKIAKYGSDDSNDIRMKDLGVGGDPGRFGNLENELEELENDPEYMEWAQNPEFSAASNMEKEREKGSRSNRMLTRTLQDMEDKNFGFPTNDLESIFEEDADALNADDELSDLEKEDLNHPITLPSPSGTDIDELLEQRILDEENPNYPTVPDELAWSKALENSVETLPDSEFYLDEDNPESYDLGIWKNRIKQQTLLNELNQKDTYDPSTSKPTVNLRPHKLPDFDEDILNWAFQQADRHFKKMADLAASEVEENEDDDFEDEE